MLEGFAAFVEVGVDGERLFEEGFCLGVVFLFGVQGAEVVEAEGFVVVVIVVKLERILECGIGIALRSCSRSSLMYSSVMVCIKQDLWKDFPVD